MFAGARPAVLTHGSRQAERSGRNAEHAPERVAHLRALVANAAGKNLELSRVGCRSS